MEARRESVGLVAGLAVQGDETAWLEGAGGEPLYHDAHLPFVDEHSAEHKRAQREEKQDRSHQERELNRRECTEQDQHFHSDLRSVSTRRPLAAAVADTDGVAGNALLTGRSWAPPTRRQRIALPDADEAS
jgi:hypothetical protein